MSFLKNIFSRDQKIQEIPELENDVQIYLKKGSSTLSDKFQILNSSQNPEPKSESELFSVEKIFQTQSQSLEKLINQLYPNSSLSEFCLALYDENSPSTYIKLKPTSIPYKLLNGTDKKLYLIPLKKTKTFTDISSSYLSMDYYSTPSKQETSSQNRKDILMSGELYSLNPLKNEFVKKQVELTEYQLITPNSKTKVVEIDQIKDISFNLLEVPQEIVKALKTQRNVITIKFYNNNMKIYHSKKSSEYEKWKKYFDYVFNKKEERIKELQLTGTIQKLNQNIFNTCEIIINNLLDHCNFDDFMSFNGSRKAFFACAKISNNVKLIENIINYKNFVRDKKFFNAWCEMQRFISHIKMIKTNQDSVISNETKEKYSNKIAELAGEVQKKSVNFTVDQQELFKDFGNIMPYDFLDETYHKLKDNGLSDEFNNCLEKSMIQLKQLSSNSYNWENFGMHVLENKDEKVSGNKNKAVYYKDNLIENLMFIFAIFFLNIHESYIDKFMVVRKIKRK